MKNIARMIANAGLRTWPGSRCRGVGHTDGRCGTVDGKGGARAYRASKRGANAKLARHDRRDERRDSSEA